MSTSSPRSPLLNLLIERLPLPNRKFPVVENLWITWCAHASRALECKHTHHKFSMLVFVEATIKDVSRETFNDDAGTPVEYFVNTLKNAEGEKLEVNSKSDEFAKYEGDTGVASIEVRTRQGGGFKLTLRKFSPAIALDAVEGVVD